MEIFEEPNRGRLGSGYWVNSENKTFIELAQDNFQLFREWKFPIHINVTEFRDSTLKPVNVYAMHFWPKPEMRVVDDGVVLRYKTHAEIWVEPKEKGLYALDKTWQRQFYPSELQFNAPDNCFNALYKFYVPWIIEEDIECEIFAADDSPFEILSTSVLFSKDDDPDTYKGSWIHFAFKKESPYLQEYRGDVYGVIEVGSNICDILIKDSEIAQRVVKEYDK